MATRRLPMLAGALKNGLSLTATGIRMPAVAADDPDTFLDQAVGHTEKLGGFQRVESLELLLELLDALTLPHNA